MWGNHKYLVFQAPVLILLYIAALIEIAAIGSGKIGSVIDNGRPLALWSYQPYNYIILLAAPDNNVAID